MHNYSLATKTNSAYARLAITGAPPLDVLALDALAAERRRLPLGAPRLVRKVAVLEAPQALDPTPQQVDAWLRRVEETL